MRASSLGPVEVPEGVVDDLDVEEGAVVEALGVVVAAAGVVVPAGAVFFAPPPSPALRTHRDDHARDDGGQKQRAAEARARQ